MDAPVGVRLGESFDFEAEQHLYPRGALTGLSTCLACFAAAFLGRQDCIWIADAGLSATCVDTDLKHLKEMTQLYPSEWEFVHDDVFGYAERRYAEGHTYDLVNLDPPTNLFPRCAAELELWCALAEEVVVLGVGTSTELSPPEGWQLTDVLRRSSFRGGTYWAVVERA